MHMQNFRYIILRDYEFSLIEDPYKTDWVYIDILSSTEPPTSEPNIDRKQ